MKKLLDGKLPAMLGTFAAYRPANMNLAINNLTKDIVDYLKWRWEDVVAVPEDHWLVSYLIIATSKLGYHTDLTPQQSFSRSDFMIEELARAFGFTTEYNAGRLHIGDNGAVTIYVIGRNPKERARINAHTPYWNMTAMRYLAHGSTNLSMGSSAEPEEGIGSGFDVIEIDIGILHWQTLQFMSYWFAKNPDDPRSIRQMVAMDVLPRLKLSQFNIATMNRMTAAVNVMPVDNTVYRLPKSFPDRHREMDNFIKAYLDGLLKRDMTFEQAIDCVPPICGIKGIDLLSMDEYAYTRQINWAILVARVSLLDFLFAVCRVTPLRSSRWPVNDITRSVKRVDGDNGLAQTMGLKMRQEFKRKVNQLLDQV